MSDGKSPTAGEDDAMQRIIADAMRYRWLRLNKFSNLEALFLDEFLDHEMEADEERS